MTTDINYTDSTAGSVLRGLREPPDGDSETPVDTHSDAANPRHLETVPSPPEQDTSNSSVDSKKTMSAARRFSQVNWTGEEVVEAPEQYVLPAAGADDEASRSRLTAAERFQSVAWDPEEAKQRRAVQREQQEKLAEEHTEKMTVKNFFGRANF